MAVFPPQEHWIVDEEAAGVVRRIFAMTLDGYGPYQIANRLSQEKVEIPSLHLSHYGEGVNQSKTFKDPYGWGSSTIVNILKKREYLGHTINFKTRKHFKDKKSHYVNENEWVIFENTHATIIAPETFENVQRIRSNVKRYPDGWGEAAPLTGLLYCADCGGKMYVHRTNNGKRISQYTCSRYSKVPVGVLCTTQHQINESAVLTLVSHMLRAIAEYSRNDRAEFIKAVQETQAEQQASDITRKRKRLAAAQKRAGELEKLICKIYEDNVLGKLPNARYAALDAQYAKEQESLTSEITEKRRVYFGQQPAKERTSKSINASQSRYIGGWHTTERTRRHTHEWTDLYKVGDYYLPNLVLKEQPDTPIGKYGRMRLRYLKEHQKGLYTSLLLTEKLYLHLLEIDEAANERMDILMPQLIKVAGVTEELKAADQMKWIGLANNCKAQAEEIILHELIYN